MDELLSPAIVTLRNTAETLTREVVAPNAAAVDAEAAWPEQSMRALADANLYGLHVPKRLGGHEQGLLALAVIGETLAMGCASSALCYAMHCVGSAVIAAKATAYHEERYLRPIAENRHLTTLALSESGTGAHFYLPQMQLTQQQQHFIANGTKQFVTNGGRADSYVISTKVSEQNYECGDFNCLIVDADSVGINWLAPWLGFGMRGNSSRGMQFNDVKVPSANLLGEQGDQIWYVFEVVAPYFLTAMAGTYVGVAQAALDTTIEHLKQRQYQHSGDALAEVQLLQHRIAEMAIAVTKSRSLLYQAAYFGDTGHARAMQYIMMAKADAADTVVSVCNDAMTCCGGKAYGENSELARRLRDARAGHVMSPTTDLLKTWIGRQLLDLPLF